jgi:hypothetical protein
MHAYDTEQFIYKHPTLFESNLRIFNSNFPTFFNRKTNNKQNDQKTITTVLTQLNLFPKPINGLIAEYVIETKEEDKNCIIL